MHRCVIAFAAIFQILPIAAQTKAIAGPEAVYVKCKTSVVTILTFDKNRAPLSQGSGFIVGSDRVVTNYHVIAGSSSASIIFSDGSMTLVSSVIAASQPKDLVIVEAETGNRLSLILGDELELKIGEAIYTIGAPNGLTSSLSNGLVSAFRQDEGQFLIQITAPIAPGSSGGPILNSQGLVVGVATSRLKDGGFSFAMGAGDVKHLLKAPLGVKITLADLPPEETTEPQENQLSSVQTLFEQKQYDAARSSFKSVPDPAKASFDGQLLLCKIEQERKEYQLSIYACNAAIKARPDVSSPYGLNAYSMLVTGDLEQAEVAASKAVQLAPDELDYRQFLGLIHYSGEKYQLVARDFPDDSNDAFIVTLLAGAALHNRDYASFRRLNAKLISLKGADNGWSLYLEGAAAEKDLNWSAALDKFRKCDADKDFIDPICEVSVVQVDLREVDLGAAKSESDIALSRYPKNHAVLSEGIFISLLLGNAAEADRLHSVMKSTVPQAQDEFSDCLYYYARSQASLATSHCQAAIQSNENHYQGWSNAGYVALDNRDFLSARADFGKALQLYSESKEKNTVTQELDVLWGSLLALYYSGDKKTAKSLYRDIKKQYPQFVTSTELKELPLIWSPYTVTLIDLMVPDLR
jgi:Flp pilus assembly protein TadD